MAAPMSRAAHVSRTTNRNGAMMGGGVRPGIIADNYVMLVSYCVVSWVWLDLAICMGSLDAAQQCVAADTTAYSMVHKGFTL
eukprot:7110647-Pyramimonas_sp.AAC.2